MRPSDVNEGINQALEVAPQGHGIDSRVTPTTSLRGQLDASEVASPESSTAQTGNTGTSATASVEVPEENVVVVRRGASESTNEAGKSAVPQKARPPLPPLSLESLAKYSDEGENGWNAQGRSDIARKMQRIAAGGYNSVEKLISKVEELAEVGQ